MTRSESRKIDGSGSAAISTELNLVKKVIDHAIDAIPSDPQYENYPVVEILIDQYPN